MAYAAPGMTSGTPAMLPGIRAAATGSCRGVLHARAAGSPGVTIPPLLGLYELPLPHCSHHIWGASATCLLCSPSRIHGLISGLTSFVALLSVADADPGVVIFAICDANMPAAQPLSFANGMDYRYRTNVRPCMLLPCLPPIANHPSLNACHHQQ